METILERVNGVNCKIKDEKLAKTIIS
jgi:hypothetical protein